MKKSLLILSIVSILIVQSLTLSFAYTPNDVYDGDNDTFETASEFRYPVDNIGTISGPPKKLSASDTVDWYKFKPAFHGDLTISIDTNAYSPEHSDYDFDPDLKLKFYLYDNSNYLRARGKNENSGTSKKIRYGKIYSDRYYYIKVVRKEGSGQYYLSAGMR